MNNLVLILILMHVKIVYNNDGDSWGREKVVWTKFNLIPKPVLSNFTKSFHSVLKNSLATTPITTTTPRAAISAKLVLNHTKVDRKGLLNVTQERKVPIDTIILSSKIVGFPQDRTVPPRKIVPTSTPSAPEALPRIRRRPVIRYQEEEDDDEDDDDEDDITDELVGDDDDDDDDEEEEVEEVVEEVPDSAIDVKNEYEDDAQYVEPITVKKTRKVKKKSKKYLKLKDFKKLRKFMLPLLLAYKLKFFTLIPLLLGGLVLIVGTTGFAGFFFALFAVGLGLQKNHHG